MSETHGFGGRELAAVSDTPTLIDALRVLSRCIESEDGVFNAVLAEAAGRLEELSLLATEMVGHVAHPSAVQENCPGCRLFRRYRLAVMGKDLW